MSYLNLSATNIVMCFLVALMTTIAFRFFIRSKRDLHFRRSQFKSVITIRGKIGDAIALGYPVTLTGFLLWLLLLSILALEIYLILRFL